MNEQFLEIARVITWAVGVPVIVLLLVSIVRRLRAIRELDARLREEEAQQAQNPYAQMARLYEQAEARERLERARRGRVD